MDDWARELAELRRHMDGRVQESERAATRWRQLADEALSGPDTAILDAAVDSAAVPADAPPQYRDVVDKFATGELDWQTVLAGATEDDGERAMSLWMDHRMQQLEITGRLVRRGVPIEDACAQAAEQVRR